MPYIPLGRGPWGSRLPPSSAANSLMDDEELEAGGSELDTSGGYTLQHRLNASSRHYTGQIHVLGEVLDGLIPEENVV